MTIAVNRNLSNCKNSPRKKVFRGFNGIRTRGLCVSAAVLSQLSYEDPYTGGWPIYWVHQPMKGMKHWMKWCELREYKWNDYVTIAVNRNLSNCENSPRKKVFRGFNGIRTRGLCVNAAVLSQLSYEDPYTEGWPIYWVHQPVKGMKHWMKWCELREYKWNDWQKWHEWQPYNGHKNELHCNCMHYNVFKIFWSHKRQSDWFYSSFGWSYVNKDMTPHYNLLAL